MSEEQSSPEYYVVYNVIGTLA